MKNPKYTRTETERQLKLDFVINNQDIIEKYEKEIGITHRDASSWEIIKKLEILDQYKNYCYNHSLGAKLYFMDTWEHCHNSKNPCFTWQSQLEKQLERARKRENQ